MRHGLDADPAELELVGLDIAGARATGREPVDLAKRAQGAVVERHPGHEGLEDETRPALEHAGAEAVVLVDDGLLEDHAHGPVARPHDADAAQLGAHGPGRHHEPRRGKSPRHVADGRQHARRPTHSCAGDGLLEAGAELRPHGRQRYRRYPMRANVRICICAGQAVGVTVDHRLAGHNDPTATEGLIIVKAVAYDRYGLPDVLTIEDVPVPAPGPSQVLVKLVATSVNLSDWECLRGNPMYARIGGLRTPARRVLGSDIAGHVEAVGPDVTRFRPGDEVYGDNLDLKGGFAEYALAPESALAHKPEALTFAEASTLPQSGAIALQGTARAQPGRRVLINGAGGGTGSFAIQLAKRAGAHVTGVDNAGKLEFMTVTGSRRRHRLPQRGLHPWRAVRPRARSGRLPLGVRLPPSPGSRWPLPLRRRHRAGPAAGPHGRHRRRSPHGSQAGCPGGEAGPAHFEPLADLCVVRRRRRSTSTAPSPSMRCPRHWRRVGEGRALGKVVVQIAQSAS